MGPLQLSLLAALWSADDIIVPPLFDILIPGCDADEECAAEDPSEPYCHPVQDECRACVETVHCEPEEVCTLGGYCEPACASDEDCSDPLEPRCDPVVGACVDCVWVDDCEADDICNDYGSCSPLYSCQPDELFCAAASLMRCGLDGMSAEEVEACAFDCDDSAEPVCVMPPEGGTSTGEVPTSTGSSATDPTDGSGTSDGMQSSDDGEATDEAIGRGCACTSAGGPALNLLWLLALGLRRRSRWPAG